MIVDFHTHILHNIDDGSKSTEMSLAMLSVMKKQGITHVVASPHYYHRRRSIEEFSAKRAASLAALKELADESIPEIIAGCELAFYHDMLSDDLHPLCIEGTDTLLLEMPFGSWTEREMDILSSLCLDKHYTVVLAHLERFWDMQADDTIDRIYELPLYVQINSASLLGFIKNKKWLSLFKDGYAHVLGSDCHNMSDRAPELGKARDIISKKLGSGILNEIDACSAKLIGHSPSSEV